MNQYYLKPTCPFCGHYREDWFCCINLAEYYRDVEDGIIKPDPRMLKQ